MPGMAAVARYWGTTFPERWSDARTHMSSQLAAPLNKINRLLTSPSIDVSLRHPFALDLSEVIRQREVLVVNGALGEVGEQNAVVVMQMLLQLVHQAMKQQQRSPVGERVRVCLKIDEAHLLLTPSFATMLAFGYIPEGAGAAGLAVGMEVHRPGGHGEADHRESFWLGSSGTRVTPGSRTGRWVRIRAYRAIAVRLSREDGRASRRRDPSLVHSFWGMA